MINWTKLRTVIKPCIGKTIAIVRDSIKGTMVLIDLRDLFVVMSDSEAEMEFCEEAVEQATGDVLTLGFGLGFTLLAMMEKPEVTSITVVEVNPEIIELVASQLKLNDKVKIVMANAVTYVPDKLYDFIWNDIDLSARDIDDFPNNITWSDRYNAYLKEGGKYLIWNDNGRYWK